MDITKLRRRKACKWRELITRLPSEWWVKVATLVWWDFSSFNQKRNENIAFDPWLVELKDSYVWEKHEIPSDDLYSALISIGYPAKKAQSITAPRWHDAKGVQTKNVGMHGGSRGR